MRTGLNRCSVQLETANDHAEYKYMDINEFISKFAEQFMCTSISKFTPNTIFWELDEWSSIVALSVVLMIEEEYGVSLRSADVKGVRTIQELFDVVKERAQ